MCVTNSPLRLELKPPLPTAPSRGTRQQRFQDFGSPVRANCPHAHIVGWPCSLFFCFSACHRSGGFYALKEQTIRH
jgi:hypothetical protein